MSEPRRWYPSKVDWWLAVILGIAPLTCIVATLSVAAARGAIWVPLAATAFLAAIYLGLVFPMRYSITDDAVVVRHGIVRQRIPLADITDVYPTRNPLSSPALSLDRLHIRFGEGFFKAVMISPRDEGEFLTELALRTGAAAPRRSVHSGLTRRKVRSVVGLR